MTAVAASSTAMTAVGSYQNSMDKIWTSAYLNSVTASSTAMAALVAKQSTINGFGYSAVNAASDHSVWNGKKVLVMNNIALNCSYSGAVKSLTLSKGTYRLAVWGAQGGRMGNNTSGTIYSNWGRGGFSTGDLTLTAPTLCYVYAGGKGAENKSSNGTVAGGFNGGGSAIRAGRCANGGGGGSDIRLLQNSLYARVIVAGGGGGHPDSSSTNAVTYGSGGGTQAWSGYGSLSTAQNGRHGGGGGATTFGVNNSTDWTSAKVAATFGAGGYATAHKGSFGCAGGGGGWYGGAFGDTDGGAGGGSGYVYTSSTASQYPSGCLLNSSYYLANASTTAGNNSFTSPTGSAETGHEGDGYCRITKIG